MVVGGNMVKEGWVVKNWERLGKGIGCCAVVKGVNLRASVGMFCNEMGKG